MCFAKSVLRACKLGDLRADKAAIDTIAKLTLLLL